MDYALLIAAVVAVLLVVAGPIYRRFRRRTYLPCGCRRAGIQSRAANGRRFVCAHGWWHAEDPSDPTRLLSSTFTPLG